jgi:hypothetical protein
MFVMLMLVESRLKLVVEESAVELELDMRCFRVELARETEAEGGREDREDLDRVEEIDGA